MEWERLLKRREPGGIDVGRFGVQEIMQRHLRCCSWRGARRLWLGGVEWSGIRRAKMRGWMECGEIDEVVGRAGEEESVTLCIETSEPAELVSGGALQLCAQFRASE